MHVCMNICMYRDTYVHEGVWIFVRMYVYACVITLYIDYTCIYEYVYLRLRVCACV